MKVGKLFVLGTSTLATAAILTLVKVPMEVEAITVERVAPLLSEGGQLVAPNSTYKLVTEADGEVVAEKLMVKKLVRQVNVGEYLANRFNNHFYGGKGNQR